MPLNQFKTQVLLLHSELSTLEQLGAGFDDRYTVHLATSGSEALQTLGETPIDVIVSAQQLPGMSGIEALREARRRSPETVGILLAGNLDDGQEALVSDSEIFEVVRGNVTSDIIINAVDSATQNLRMMTLTESANDNAVDANDSAARARPLANELVNDEHIIMETTEDGQAVITDASGRLPALDTNKAARAAAVTPRPVDLLVLTKDQEFLGTIRKTSQGGHGVHHANTLAEADEVIRERRAGVTVIDAGMIGKRIEQLIEYLRRGSPRLVFIVAGRRDDGDMLMDLINRGKVYRFLLKPVSPGRARLAIEASAKHHLDAPDAVFANRPSAAATPMSAANDETTPGTTAAAQAGSFDNDGPGSVFGGGEIGLGDTLIDLFRTINEKLTGHDEPETAEDTPAASTQDPETPVSRFGRKGTVLAGIAAAAVVAIGILWFAGGNDAATTT
ncbi:MAG: response regulator, partial [Woeseiaceae bacterium]|nr:response regulator [Woeseiaceae bacterium]